MEHTLQRSDLNAYGVFVVKVPGITDLFERMRECGVDWSTEWSFADNIWYMTAKFMTIGQKNKQSVYVMNPNANPGPYGDALRNFNAAVMTGVMPDGKTIGEYVTQTHGKVQNGVHYYTKTGTLEAHNDINRLTCLYSDDITSIQLGTRWYTIGRGSAADYPLATDELVAMWGISTYLETRNADRVQLPIFHKVDETISGKFTVGVFIDAPDGLLLKDICGRSVTSSYFQGSYFRSIPTTDDNRDLVEFADKLKNTQII